MPKTSQLTRRIAAASIIAGIKKHLPPKGPYYMSGRELSRDELVAVFEAQVDAIDAIRTARAALSAAVARERAVARRLAPQLPLFRDALCHLLGFRSEVLADFGWRLPKKPGPKTATAKLAGVEKGRATRKARGTMGKRQRQKIEA
jgi:hypothetical protein